MHKSYKYFTEFFGDFVAFEAYKSFIVIACESSASAIFKTPPTVIHRRKSQTGLEWRKEE